MVDISLAISWAIETGRITFENEGWVLDGEAYNGLNWRMPTVPKPTLAQIETWDQERIAAKPDDDARKKMDVGPFERALFDVLFDMENRTRVLESRSAVTRNAYATAVRNIVKSYL